MKYSRKDFFRKSLSDSIEFAVEKTRDVMKDFTPSTEEMLSEVIPSQKASKKKKSRTVQGPKLANKPRKIHRGLNYPPGAVTPEEKFLKLCTGCNECMLACPYSVIFPVYDEERNKQIPRIDVNLSPCRMCNDWPCITACNFNALKPLKKKEPLKFGQARGVFERCLNSIHGKEICTSCKEACPVEGVVKIRNGKPSFAKSCTGCGICVQSCPTFPKAIVIR